MVNSLKVYMYLDPDVIIYPVGANDGDIAQKCISFYTERRITLKKDKLFVFCHTVFVPQFCRRCFLLNLHLWFLNWFFFILIVFLEPMIDTYGWKNKEILVQLNHPIGI